MEPNTPEQEALIKQAVEFAALANYAYDYDSASLLVDDFLADLRAAGYDVVRAEAV